MKYSFHLKDLEKQIKLCRKCILYQTAMHAVAGEGDPHAQIMFIGEAPGRIEDQTGRPFVGRAGRLLDQLLQSIGLERSAVFITSVIKHRPPANRQPKPNEVKACSNWLRRQLFLIQPKMVVTLGRFGLEFFMPKAKISLIHGTIQEAYKYEKQFTLFPLYHPAAGLRSTRNKETLFKDFKQLKKTIQESNI